MKDIITIDNNQRFPRGTYYVVKDEQLDVGAIHYVTPETILNENSIVAVKEQVPETWEELFCYCENNIPCILGNDRDCLMVCGVTFDKKGTIDKDGLIIINNRTIPQMWNIIKSLIGEKR